MEAKDTQIADLQQALAEARQLCTERGVNLDKILQAKGFDRVAAVDAAADVLVDRQVRDAIDDAVEQVIVNDDLKRRFLVLARQVLQRYKAILPDRRANEFTALRACFAVLVEKVRGFAGEVRIAHVMEKVDDLLEIDFEKLRAWFEKSRKRTAAEKMRRSVEQKLRQMVEKNKTRTDLLEKFQRLIAEYNAGQDVESFFERLVDFVRALNEEEKRGVAEQLTDEELAVFDILTKPEMPLKPPEVAEVKKVARNLLITLKQAKLVLDWRKKQRARADVYATIKEVLDELPRAYDTDAYNQKVDAVYQHVFESYGGEGKSIYAVA